MTGNLSSGNVTVVESYYNEDSIWVGLRIEGEELVNHHVYSLFQVNGETIGAGSHGGSLEIDTEVRVEETVR